MVGPQNDLLELAAKRHEVLEAIETGTREKRNLTEELAVSRPTVDRAVRELEDARLVVRESGECALTLLGRLVWEHFGELLETFESLASSAEITCELPANAPIDSRAIDGAAFSTNTERIPARPLPIRSDIDGSREMKAVLNKVFPQCVEKFHEHANDHLTVEFVMHTDALEMVREVYGHPTRERLCQSGYEVYRTDDTPPFDAFLVDRDLVFVRVYSRHEGALVGTIENVEDAAVRWAGELFDTLKRDADPVVPRELTS